MQEYCSEVIFPSPGHLLDPGVKLVSLALVGRFFTTEPPEKPYRLELFSHSVMSNSLWPHRLQNTRLPCLSPSPRACSNSCPLSQWCHPTILSSVIPFSSFLQSFSASRSLLISWLLASGGQNIRASTSVSVLPMNIKDWYLEMPGLISLQFKGLSRVFSNSTLQKHQFFGTQPYVPTLTSIHKSSFQ